MDVFQNKFDVPIIHVWGMAETSPLVPRTSVGKVDKKVIRARYPDEAYDIVERTE